MNKNDKNYVGDIRLRPEPTQTTVHTLARPIATVAKCKHDWPEGDRGTDMDGTCTKCGMSFQLYIHTQCP